MQTRRDVLLTVLTHKSATQAIYKSRSFDHPSVIAKMPVPLEDATTPREMVNPTTLIVVAIVLGFIAVAVSFWLAKRCIDRAKGGMSTTTTTTVSRSTSCVGDDVEKDLDGGFYDRGSVTQTVIYDPEVPRSSGR